MVASSLSLLMVLLLFSLLLLLVQPALPLPLVVGEPDIERKPSDSDALTIFRLRADAHGNLAPNWSTPDACSGKWRGVGCSADGRVISLSLPSIDLRGPLDPLAHLDQLRLLDLHGNRLNGTLLPLLSSLTNLKLLYLSRNDLSGPIPPSISVLGRLLRLDLSDNDLSGPVPGDALSNLTRLLTLRLQDNLLSGTLPDLSVMLPRLAEFNASNNELEGRVPDGMLSRFGMPAIAGNAGLCGSIFPLRACSLRPQYPAPSSSSSSSQTQTVVPSNPSSMPGSSSIHGGGNEEQTPGRERQRHLSSTARIVGIVVVNAVLVLAVAAFLIAYYCARRFKGRGEDNGGNGGRDSHLVEVDAEKKKGSSDDDGDAEASQSKLVFFEGGEEERNDDGSEGKEVTGRGRRRRRMRRVRRGIRKRFELEDLLRASAEMVGKGSVGTVYAVVLEDGCMVAVKRLRDANPCPRREFDSYMGIIGRLWHPNLVPLRAYYYAKQEKLLIYDFLPNGSLYSLLHGNRGGEGRIPLDWTTRIGLVLGAGRGLARIHEEYSSSKIPHGNIKSSNVLLDHNGVACISDFGLALLLNPAHATARLGGYRAPEQNDTKRLSQEADVYAFGVMILEVLTGKASSQHPPASKGDGYGGGSTGISLPGWVRSVVREEWTAEVFDAELMRYKNIEDEMVAMLHVGLACVAQQADKRPTMHEVVKMIEDLRVEQSPMAAEDPDDPRASLSPSLAASATTTEDGRLSY